MWVQKYAFTMVWEQVLKSVFKSAYRESSFALDDGAQPLKWVREARSELWWQTYAFLAPPAKRQKTGIQHAKAGRQRTSWEGPFVAAWGMHWRSHRDQSKSLAEWMQQWGAFRSQLASAWQLPWLDFQPAVANLEGRWVTHRLPTAITDIPHVVPNPRSSKWGSASGRL